MHTSCRAYFKRQGLCHSGPSCAWPVTHAVQPHQAALAHRALPSAVFCATLAGGRVAECTGVETDLDCDGRQRTSAFDPPLDRLQAAAKWLGLVARALPINTSASHRRRYVAFSPADLVLLDPAGKRLASRLHRRGSPLFAGATTRADHDAGVQFMIDVTFAEAHQLVADHHHSLPPRQHDSLPLPHIEKAVWRGAPSGAASVCTPALCPE
eukprot:7381442-Prymnesium_polylepis.1